MAWLSGIGLDQQSYFTPGLLSTGMGDHLQVWAGKSPWFVTSQSGQLSLLPLAG